jgi:hypothetical protein
MNFDNIELIFNLYKNKMIDMQLWMRWKATAAESMMTIPKFNAAESMMTIPKFKKVWNNTKFSRSKEFKEFIDMYH